jgi:hypothetical protein
MAISPEEYRILEVRAGKVACLPGKDETIEHCRFCVHSRYFKVGGEYVLSPSLVFCVQGRDAGVVNLKEVEAVKCADRHGEGYRSMMSIIG